MLEGQKELDDVARLFGRMKRVDDQTNIRQLEFDIMYFIVTQDKGRLPEGSMFCRDTDHALSLIETNKGLTISANGPRGWMIKYAGCHWHHRSLPLALCLAAVGERVQTLRKEINARRYPRNPDRSHINRDSVEAQTRFESTPEPGVDGAGSADVADARDAVSGVYHGNGTYDLRLP